MTGAALRHARDVIFGPGNGQRDGVRKVLVVVTNGDSDSTSPVEAVAKDLRTQGTLVSFLQPPSFCTPSRDNKLNFFPCCLQIYAIGVGFELDPDKLVDITRRKDRVYYQEDGFDALNQNLADEIGRAICRKGM